MANRTIQGCFIITLVFLSCSSKKKELEEQMNNVRALELSRGEITLCGSGVDQFGTVSFSMGCSEKVLANFNLATALLHSFEYGEAEKVFAKVIDEDPQCVMAYWGAAMCNFHPLWAPPSPQDLDKGSKIVAAGRKIVQDPQSREALYLNAIAAIYDEWQSLDHRSRLLEFEERSRKVYEKYPNDEEAAIFYSLALGAAADPKDKSFAKQKKAGDILGTLFSKRPDHPGIAHYLIHNYDYPELAELGLPAARKYASIAASSAHAQHMPSHIFTRLGLWDEAIQSNINSMNAAKCYAENVGIKGHWDEELHGLDYLVYAYLQKGNDEKAMEQLRYLNTIQEVFPVNFKDAYCFAAVPSRYAVERKDWRAAASLTLSPVDFPWQNFPWEKANFHFARLLGAAHTGQLALANAELKRLDSIRLQLSENKESYKANLVQIQSKSGHAWIMFKTGQRKEAFELMREAAEMEEATAKHPVTPGEIIPARELLADMYYESADYPNAIKEYEADLKKHPNRLNALYGLVISAQRAGDVEKAERWYKQLLTVAPASTRVSLTNLEMPVKAKL
jgi:tetratricopeptide (TPR) repeat protein